MMVVRGATGDCAAGGVAHGRVPMSTRHDYQPRPAPPAGRLWDAVDVAAYAGIGDLTTFLAHHRDFPPPLAMRVRGRRWRSCDVVAYFDRLAERSFDATPVEPDAFEAIPEFVPARADSAR
jgi:hypothetical protein